MPDLPPPPSSRMRLSAASSNGQLDPARFTVAPPRNQRLSLVTVGGFESTKNQPLMAFNGAEGKGGITDKSVQQLSLTQPQCAPLMVEPSGDNKVSRVTQSCDREALLEDAMKDTLNTLDINMRAPYRPTRWGSHVATGVFRRCMAALRSGDHEKLDAHSKQGMATGTLCRKDGSVDRNEFRFYDQLPFRVLSKLGLSRLVNAMNGVPKATSVYSNTAADIEFGVQKTIHEQPRLKLQIENSKDVIRSIVTDLSECLLKLDENPRENDLRKIFSELLKDKLGCRMDAKTLQHVNTAVAALTSGGSKAQKSVNEKRRLILGQVMWHANAQKVFRNVSQTNMVFELARDQIDWFGVFSNPDHPLAKLDEIKLDEISSAEGQANNRRYEILDHGVVRHVNAKEKARHECKSRLSIELDRAFLKSYAEKLAAVVEREGDALILRGGGCDYNAMFTGRGHNPRLEFSTQEMSALGKSIKGQEQLVRMMFGVCGHKQIPAWLMNMMISTIPEQSGLLGLLDQHNNDWQSHEYGESMEQVVPGSNLEEQYRSASFMGERAARETTSADGKKTITAPVDSIHSQAVVNAGEQKISRNNTLRHELGEKGPQTREAARGFQRFLCSIEERNKWCESEAFSGKHFPVARAQTASHSANATKKPILALYKNGEILSESRESGGARLVEAAAYPEQSEIDQYALFPYQEGDAFPDSGKPNQIYFKKVADKQNAAEVNFEIRLFDEDALAKDYFHIEGDLKAVLINHMSGNASDEDVKARVISRLVKGRLEMVSQALELGITRANDSGVIDQDCETNWLSSLHQAHDDSSHWQPTDSTGKSGLAYTEEDKRVQDTFGNRYSNLHRLLTNHYPNILEIKRESQEAALKAQIEQPGFLDKFSTTESQQQLINIFNHALDDYEDLRAVLENQLNKSGLLNDVKEREEVDALKKFDEAYKELVSEYREIPFKAKPGERLTTEQGQKRAKNLFLLSIKAVALRDVFKKVQVASLDATEASSVFIKLFGRLDRTRKAKQAENAKQAEQADQVGDQHEGFKKDELEALLGKVFARKDISLNEDHKEILRALLTCSFTDGSGSAEESAGNKFDVAFKNFCMSLAKVENVQGHVLGFDADPQNVEIAEALLQINSLLEKELAEDKIRNAAADLCDLVVPQAAFDQATEKNAYIKISAKDFAKKLDEIRLKYKDPDVKHNHMVNAMEAVLGDLASGEGEFATRQDLVVALEGALLKQVKRSPLFYALHQDPSTLTEVADALGLAVYRANALKVTPATVEDHITHPLPVNRPAKARGNWFVRNLSRDDRGKADIARGVPGVAGVGILISAAAALEGNVNQNVAAGGLETSGFGAVAEPVSQAFTGLLAVSGAVGMLKEARLMKKLYRIRTQIKGLQPLARTTDTYAKQECLKVVKQIQSTLQPAANNIDFILRSVPSTPGRDSESQASSDGVSQASSDGVFDPLLDEVKKALLAKKYNQVDLRAYTKMREKKLQQAQEAYKAQLKKEGYTDTQIEKLLAPKPKKEQKPGRGSAAVEPSVVANRSKSWIRGAVRLPINRAQPQQPPSAQRNNSFVAAGAQIQHPAPDDQDTGTSGDTLLGQLQALKALESLGDIGKVGEPGTSVPPGVMQTQFSGHGSAKQMDGKEFPKFLSPTQLEAKVAAAREALDLLKYTGVLQPSSSQPPSGDEPSLLSKADAALSELEKLVVNYKHADKARHSAEWSAKKIEGHMRSISREARMSGVRLFTNAAWVTLGVVQLIKDAAVSGPYILLATCLVNAANNHRDLQRIYRQRRDRPEVPMNTGVVGEHKDEATNFLLNAAARLERRRNMWLAAAALAATLVAAHLAVTEGASGAAHVANKGVDALAVGLASATLAMAVPVARYIFSLFNNNATAIAHTVPDTQAALGYPGESSPTQQKRGYWVGNGVPGQAAESSAQVSEKLTRLLERQRFGKLTARERLAGRSNYRLARRLNPTPGLPSWPSFSYLRSLARSGAALGTAFGDFRAYSEDSGRFLWLLGIDNKATEKRFAREVSPHVNLRNAESVDEIRAEVLNAMRHQVRADVNSLMLQWETLLDDIAEYKKQGFDEVGGPENSMGSFMQQLKADHKALDTQIKQRQALLESLGEFDRYRNKELEGLRLLEFSASTNSQSVSEAAKGAMRRAIINRTDQAFSNLSVRYMLVMGGNDLMVKSKLQNSDTKEALNGLVAFDQTKKGHVRSASLKPDAALSGDEINLFWDDSGSKAAFTPEKENNLLALLGVNLDMALSSSSSDENIFQARMHREVNMRLLQTVYEVVPRRYTRKFNALHSGLRMEYREPKLLLGKSELHAGRDQFIRKQ